MLLKLMVYINLKNGVFLLLFVKKKMIVYNTDNIFSKRNN